MLVQPFPVFGHRPPGNKVVPRVCMVLDVLGFAWAFWSPQAAVETLHAVSTNAET